MVRTFLAERRVIHAAHGGGEPEPALLVEHGVVVVGARVPQFFARPNRPTAPSASRAGMSGTQRFRHLGSAHRHLEERHFVRLRIEDRHVVGGIFRRAVQRAVGIDRRIAPVRRNQIVQIFVGRRPLPRSDRRCCARRLAAAAAWPSAIRPWRRGRSSRRDTCTARRRISRRCGWSSARRTAPIERAASRPLRRN